MNDNDHFMRKALEEAEKALSRGDFPVGCVLVHQRRVIVTSSRMGTASGSANELDHAEMLALRKLDGLPGLMDRRQIRLFCTMEPCLMCFAAILLSGIGEIVYAYEDVMGGGTRINLKELAPLYRERQIAIVPGILREQSLALFKTFFQNPENHYWRGSPLASYTLGSVCSSAFRRCCTA